MKRVFLRTGTPQNVDNVNREQCVLCVLLGYFRSVLVRNEAISCSDSLYSPFFSLLLNKQLSGRIWTGLMDGLVLTDTSLKLSDLQLVPALYKKVISLRGTYST